MKSVAVCGSIALCACLGPFFLVQPFNVTIAMGVCCTILAILNYQDNGGDSAVAEVAVAEKPGQAEDMEMADQSSPIMDDPHVPLINK